jgi:hypothetical protein
MASVRELIGGIQRTVRDSWISPGETVRAAEQADRAAGERAGCPSRARSGVPAPLRRLPEQFEKANAAKIEAEASSQYASWREAQDLKTVTEQLIISLRSSVRLHTEEMRMGGGR